MLYTVRKKISLITKSKNDYVITIKGNQKNLDQRIQDLSNSSKPESCFLEQDNSQGRKISRKIEVFKVRKK
jgi:hypothetical protein